MSERMVMVVEFDARDPLTREDVHDALLRVLSAKADPNSDSPSTGYVAIKEDAEMVLDVFRAPELGGGTHTMVVKSNGYVIEHSLRCRRTGQMTDCPYIPLADEEWHDEMDWPEGRWTLGISEVQEEHGVDRMLTVTRVPE